jgi:hypothetical protein
LTWDRQDVQFLGLQIDNNLNWKRHIEYIIPKLSSACFTMRTNVPLMRVDTLKLVYYAYFHSVLSYELIFWGNSTDSNKIFIIQKKIIRIMAGVKSRASCRTLFQKFNILPLASEFIFCLLSFVVEHLDKFQRNTDVHKLNTRRKFDLHMPNANLTNYQKGVYHTGIKLFNHLPPTIKSLNYDIKVFKPALKDYLLSHSFYSVDNFCLC